ncbi:MAG: SAM-dependent methyltransferase [Collinsella sp.]
MTQNSAHTGKLYVVGTPIGNLGDLSPRVGEAFAAADAICCEDTRVTSKLLMHLGISKPLVRCDENVIASRAAGLVDRLLAGETLAFASDAGMPSVSDPGQALVEAAREADVPVEVIPGPSACVTALVSSGIPCEHFSSKAFWVASTATACADCSALPCARRAHLLRVSTSHRGDARGRGGGLSPA